MSNAKAKINAGLTGTSDLASFLLNASGGKFGFTMGFINGLAGEMGPAGVMMGGTSGFNKVPGGLEIMVPPGCKGLTGEINLGAGVMGPTGGMGTAGRGAAGMGAWATGNAGGTMCRAGVTKKSSASMLTIGIPGVSGMHW
jgi:hypothetical protein